MNGLFLIYKIKLQNREMSMKFCKKCFGHKMGPLETADFIGLDAVVNSLDILYESYRMSKFRCAPLLRRMVEAGLHGRKSGKVIL